jgi:nicotinamidase-related amidase
MKPALLVIDMQNELSAEDSPARSSLRAAAEYINATIRLFRRAAAPVFIISDIEEPDRVPGRDPFGLHPSTEAHPDDPRIDKRSNNAFWQTSWTRRSARGRSIR